VTLVILRIDDQLGLALAQHRASYTTIRGHAEARQTLSRLGITLRIVSKLEFIARLVEQQQGHAAGRQRFTQAFDNKWYQLVKVRPLCERIGEFMDYGRPVFSVCHELSPENIQFLSHKRQSVVHSAGKEQLKLTAS
jgi:hypothetical protein